MIFKEFFEAIANVKADQLKTEMAVDQKITIINERVDQTNTKVADFKHELDKYEKQFLLLREDQSNVREELVRYKEKVVQKMNEINDNFLQESTKLRLL